RTDCYPKWDDFEPCPILSSSGFDLPTKSPVECRQHRPGPRSRERPARLSASFLVFLFVLILLFVVILLLVSLFSVLGLTLTPLSLLELTGAAFFSFRPCFYQMHFLDRLALLVEYQPYPGAGGQTLVLQP